MTIAKNNIEKVTIATVSLKSFNKTKNLTNKKIQIPKHNNANKNMPIYLTILKKIVLAVGTISLRKLIKLPNTPKTILIKPTMRNKPTIRVSIIS
jgi:hypothetical protein